MPISPKHIFLIFGLFASSGFATAADAEGRVALLIGNSDYKLSQLALKNPRNDATALGEALKGEGFDVIEAIDQDVDGMRHALELFSDRSIDAEIALFFYAGHGVQMAGENFFLGVDYDGLGARDAQALSLNMSEVREALERGRPEASLIIIDACRNTPFAESGIARPGLVRARGGAGIMIAYATDPGNVALDGEGNNSVFTEALLEHIDTPGLDVRLMFGRVRQQVVLDTNGTQVPWVEEALLGEHVLSTRPYEPPVSDAVEKEISRWRQISVSGDTRALKSYLSDYPEGLFSEIAQERIELLDATPSAAPGDPEDLLAEASPESLAAALSTLGVLTRGAPADTYPVDELAAAFERYRRQLPDNAAVGPDRLFSDATRSSMILAGATAQQIRTDMVALRSVDRALGVARDALEDVEEIASRNPEALPVLEQGRKDVAAIEAARETVLRRLDQSRDYYDSIITRAVRFVPEGATSDILGTASAGRSLSDIDAAVRGDAELFLDQVSRVRQDREGSYIWLADFTPKDQP